MPLCYHLSGDSARNGFQAALVFLQFHTQVNEGVRFAVLRSLHKGDLRHVDLEPGARHVDGILEGQPGSRGNTLTGPKRLALNRVKRFVHLEIPGNLVPVHAFEVASATDPARQVENFRASRGNVDVDVSGSVAIFALGSLWRLHICNVP